MKTYPLFNSAKRKSITLALDGMLSRFPTTISALPAMSSPTIPDHVPSSWMVPYCLSGDTDQEHLPAAVIAQ